MKESASSSFCFTFLKMVACFWKVVVLCHTCDRSLLFGCHLLSLAFLDGGVAGHRRVGTRRPGWKRFRLSLFSQWCWWIRRDLAGLLFSKFGCWNASFLIPTTFLVSWSSVHSFIFILSYLFARGNLECESVHSFNGSALGLVLYAFWIFDLQKG